MTQTASEKSVVEAIKRALLKKYEGCKFIKTHGSQFMEAGTPDLLGCVQGLFVAIEVKRIGGKPTDLQLARLEQWRKAGAITGIATSPEEAIALISPVLEENGAIDLRIEKMEDYLSHLPVDWEEGDKD